jgi:hypothetical protein
MIATITETVSSSAGLIRVLPSVTGGECRGMTCTVTEALYGLLLYRGCSLEENGGTAATADLKWFLGCCCRICVKIRHYSSHGWHAGTVIWGTMSSILA